MQLSKFLELSAQEELQQNTILRLYKGKKSEDFYNTLVRYNPYLLLKLSIVNPEIDRICQQRLCDNYWLGLWASAGNNRVKDEGDRVEKYLPMPTVSCLNLLKGLYVYEAYLEMLEREEISVQLQDEAKEYLMTASRYGCFFAMNDLCLHGLELLKSNFVLSLVNQIVQCGLLAAKFYLSPGYFLLANVYQELYRYQELIPGPDLRIKAFQCMLMAKKLEDVSTAMINNAYQGRGLLGATNGAVKDFSVGLERLQRLLRLNPYEIEVAYEEANSESAEIKAKLRQEEAIDEVVRPSW